SWTGCVEHAVADEACMQGFVAGAPTGYQRHLGLTQHSSANKFPIGSQFDYVGVRSREAIEAFVEHRLDCIHEPLHPGFLRLAGVRTRRIQSFSNVARRVTWRPYSAIKASTAWFRRAFPKSGTVRLTTRVPTAS